MQSADEVAPHGAAHAAVVHLKNLFAGAVDQIGVDADRAKLVDDDRVALAVVAAQDVIEQRGFSRTQVAREHRHRDALNSLPRHHIHGIKLT